MTSQQIQTSQFIPEPAPLSTLIGTDFYKTHNALKSGLYDEFWEKGGRGSLKSSFVALKIIMGMMEDPNANCVAYRLVADTLADSVKASFAWAIDTLGWSEFWEIPKARNVITRKSTGQRIIMRGLDDPLKSKSIRPRKGYFKYLWFEEGAEYNSLEDLESVTQSVLRGGNKFVQFVTFNPPVEPKHWINVEAATPKVGRHVNFSCYLNAPKHWLGSKFLDDAEEMKRRNPDKHANVYLGKSVGRSDRIIFSGCYTIRAFEVAKRGHRYFIDGHEVDGPYLGADFGFANDPGTLVKCWRDPILQKIYVEYAAYGHHVKLTASKPDEIGMKEFYKQVPCSDRDMIYADSSRPETIVHMRDQGFVIDAAEKGTGSVEDGIEWLRGHEIVIHDRCIELQDEAIKYVYKVDRATQVVKSDIVDAFNHGWDAIRYAFWQLIKQAPKGILDVDFLAEEQEAVEPERDNSHITGRYEGGDDFLI